MAEEYGRGKLLNHGNQEGEKERLTGMGQVHDIFFKETLRVTYFLQPGSTS
jgi:hypothetical protein